MLTSIIILRLKSYRLVEQFGILKRDGGKHMADLFEPTV
jgi:hypothetical protein